MNPLQDREQLRRRRIVARRLNKRKGTVGGAEIDSDRKRILAHWKRRLFDFDFRWSDEEEWTIEIATTDGANLRLEKGGERLFVDGAEQPSQGPGEYPDIYRHLDRKSVV